MKKIHTLFAFAAILSAALSCNKEANSVEEPITDNERVVEFSTEPMTKTVFGTLDGTTYPTLWTENKTVAVSLNYATAKESTTPALVSGGTSANFTAAITDDAAETKKLLAVSPFSAIISTSSFNSDYKSIKFKIETDQTPLANSVDEDDQVLAAFLNAGSTLPASVGLTFNHVAAYGQFSLVNLGLAPGESVASISMTSTLDWAGQFYYYFEDNTHGNNAGDITVAAGSNTINLATTSTSNIWFACAPVAIGGTTVHLVVTTNTGTTYSKDVNFPAGKQFQSGKVAKFAIDMDGITADGASVYSLVTDPDELTVGSEVIIVANGAENSDYAAGAQSGNLRSVVAITKTGSTIVSPSASVSVFTLGRGVNSNYYSFAESTNYLTAPGSGNNINVSATLDAASTWKIDFSGAAPAVSSTSSTATQVNLRYNYNSGNPRFTCYVSGQDDIAIYKLDGSGNDDAIITYIDIPSTFAATVGTSASLGASTNSSASISYESSDPTVATVNSSGTISPLKAGSCNITASISATGSYQAVTVVCAVTVSAAETWAETAITSLTASDVFVMVATLNSSGATYAVSNNNGTSSSPSTVAVTIADGKISGTVTDNMKWKIGGNGTAGYTFYKFDDAEQWLFCNTTASSSNNNNLRVGNNDSRKLFLLNGDNRLETKDAYTKRYIGINGTSDFRGYTGTTGQCTFKFYKKQ